MSNTQSLTISATDIINGRNGYCLVLMYDPTSVSCSDMQNIYDRVKNIVEMPVLALPNSLKLFSFKDRESCIEKIEEWLQKMKNNEDIY